MKRKLITGGCAYILIGLFVFGWTYNHTSLCFHGPHPDTKQVGDWCYTEEWREGQAGVAGALWPVVGALLIGVVAWHGITQAAIYMTRWP
jgi:hypothetical protein